MENGNLVSGHMTWKFEMLCKFMFIEAKPRSANIEEAPINFAHKIDAKF